MGIYNRDYYRQRFDPSFGQSPWNMQPGGPMSITPVVKWLLIINIGVFILEFLAIQAKVPFFQSVSLDMFGQAHFQASQFEKTFGLFPSYLIGRFYIWQFITYQFVHGGFWHLFFNMFSLFMIGRYVERQIGSSSFLKLYLVGGVFAGLINMAFHLFIDYPTVGASGSICAVLAAFGLMNPHARLMMFFLFFPVIMKARTLVIVFAAITALMALTAQDGIAHLAHLGGLVFGWMYVYNILNVKNLIDWEHHPTGQNRGSHSWWSALTSLFKPKPRLYKGEEFEDGAFKEPSSQDPSWNPRIDEILDKMSRQGMHALSDEEWEILQKFRRK